MSSTEEFVCVECGKHANELYRKYPGGVIKIASCDACNSIADKYIEFDPIIVVLDIILHKIQAYRHLLCNTKHKWASKLAFILLFCDAYSKWERLQRNDPPVNGTIINAAVEIQFYAMLLQALIEWVVFYLVIFASLRLVKKLGYISHERLSPSAIFYSIAIASFGKLLIVPASIWSLSQNQISSHLMRLFVFSSNHVALKARFSVHPIISVCILTAAFSLQHAALYLIPEI